jgi:hypothetical protein
MSLPPKPHYVAEIIFLDTLGERHEIRVAKPTRKAALAALQRILRRDYPPRNGYLTIALNEYIVPREKAQ